jgi:hypothetical protein
MQVPFRLPDHFTQEYLDQLDNVPFTDDEGMAS